MDFRIPGLPHSVVKYAQSTSVRELTQKIDNHPNRHAPQQDLRQNQSFNPFSPESKQMIQDVGNIELCELLETEPTTQCTVFYHTGISVLYCTCGAFLAIRKRGQPKIHQLYDGPSFTPSVCHQEGKTSIWYKAGRQRIYFSAYQLKKKCKKTDFQGIHDRFIRDPEFRIRKIEYHRDEDLCRRWDALADEDHTHHLTAQEYLHF